MTSREQKAHHYGTHSNAYKFNSSVYTRFLLQYFSDKNFKSSTYKAEILTVTLLAILLV